MEIGAFYRSMYAPLQELRFFLRSQSDLKVTPVERRFSPHILVTAADVLS